MEPSFDRLNDVIGVYSAVSAQETKILLASLRPAELALVLESLPPNNRSVVWELLEEEPRNQTLQAPA